MAPHTTQYYILTQCFPPVTGGIEILMAGLATELARSGKSVSVFADGAPGPDNDASFKRDGIVMRRFTGPRPIRRAYKGIVSARAARGAQGIFCDSWKSLESLGATSHPIGVFAHGSELTAPSDSKIRRLKRTFAKADVVIADSNFAADLARPHMTARQRLCVVCPPIPAQPEAPRAVIDELNRRIGSRSLLIAGLARLEPRKGFDRVIEAVARLMPTHPELRFVLAGSGDDRGRLEALARDLGVAAHVTFLGRVDDATKAALFSIADVFAMPTRQVGTSVEGFGLVYSEAGWYGAPAIAGRVGGARDAVLDEKTGLVIDGDSVDAVAGAIVTLAADPDYRRKLGEAAAAHVRASGTWTTGLQAYLNALHGTDDNRQS